MVSRSALNDLRRRAAEGLLAQRRETENRPVAGPEVLDALRADARRRTPQPPIPDTPVLVPLVRTRDQLDATLGWKPTAPLRRPARVWCDLDELRAIRAAIGDVRGAGLEAGCATPRILMPGEEGSLQRLLEMRPDTLLVRNLGALAYCREAAPGLPLVADHALNAVNELTVDRLAAWGASRIVPGHDLSAERLADLASRVAPARLEVVAHGSRPMFHTAHCLYAANLGGGRSCAHCDRPCDRHRLVLEDRKGARHPVSVDAAGRNTVFEGTPSTLAKRLPALLAAGIRHVRVEFLHETATETRAVLETFGAILAATRESTIDKHPAGSDIDP